MPNKNESDQPNTQIFEFLSTEKTGHSGFKMLIISYMMNVYVI